jgi:cell division protein FtsW
MSRSGTILRRSQARPHDRVETARGRARDRHPTAAAAPIAGRATAYILLFAVIVVLTLIGLVMVLSASSVTSFHSHGTSWYVFKKQVLYDVLGAVCLVMAARFDYHRWKLLAKPLLVLSIAMLVLVLVPGMGLNVNGSTRWLGFGPIQVQPSELAKLALLLFAADLLSRRSDRVVDTRITLRPVIAVFAVVAGLVMLQPNLGTTIVLAAITFTVLFAAGTPLAPLTGWGLAGSVAAVALALGKSYRRARVLAFLDPWKDPLHTGYQTIQSQVSLASGGLFGVGLGNSRAKWGFLPFASTDFIFAIIGEELGLLGAFLVVALFAAIGYLGVRTAVRAPDRFGQLVAGGITAWICVQAFVNIGAVIGMLPVTGVPLPFVSFGGSALVTTMLAAGILLNVARSAR